MMEEMKTIGLVILMLLSAASARSQNLDSLAQDAIDFAALQLNKSIESLGDSSLFPRSTAQDGKWKTVEPADWTSGFFPGVLWYAYELTGTTSLRRQAERWTARLAEQQYNTRTHDVGFMIYCSFGNGYRLHPTQAYKQTLLHAATSLSTRFNTKVGGIRSWDNSQWDFPIIIDNLMNLELLLWASENGGGKHFYAIAVEHAYTTMRQHVRSDGSTFHVVSFDTSSGKVLTKETHQGYANESVWARGQAWGLYGFTMVYRETGERKFLETAQRLANWYIEHLPGDFVPYWDFKAPLIPNEPRDCSSAAIAASALFDLGGLTKSRQLKHKYLRVAECILASLCSSRYLARGTPSSGVLVHATGNWPAKTEIDVSLIYADYYFLEALARYRRLQKD
jgi:hypothetical protein